MSIVKLLFFVLMIYGCGSKASEPASSIYQSRDACNERESKCYAECRTRFGYRGYGPGATYAIEKALKLCGGQCFEESQRCKGYKPPARSLAEVCKKEETTCIDRCDATYDYSGIGGGSTGYRFCVEGCFKERKRCLARK